MRNRNKETLEFIKKIVMRRYQNSPNVDLKITNKSPIEHISSFKNVVYLSLDQFQIIFTNYQQFEMQDTTSWV